MSILTVVLLAATVLWWTVAVMLYTSRASRERKQILEKVEKLERWLPI